MRRPPGAAISLVAVNLSKAYRQSAYGSQCSYWLVSWHILVKEIA